jgi:hypothetical protein
MGGACDTYGGQQKSIQGFSGDTWGKVTTWKTQAYIKMDLREVGWGAWATSMLLRIGTGGGLVWLW